MPVEGEILYRSRADILAQMLDEFQTIVSDVYLGPDGNLYLLLQVNAGVEESVFLANQVLSEDMFIETANPVALGKWGQEFGYDRSEGHIAEGFVLISGSGGEHIPFDMLVASDPGSGDLLYFRVAEEGIVPDVGTPTAPTVAAGGIGSNAAGLYEYEITFVTAQGESLPGASSVPYTSVGNPTDGRISLSAVPLGGTGCIARNVYKQVNGGGFFFLAQIANNSTTTYQDTGTVAVTATTPPVTDTSAQVLLLAKAENPGRDYNVDPNQITILASATPGLTGVTNPEAFAGGSEQDDDETYRRKLLAFVRAPFSGSPSDLKLWAEQDEEVEQATVYPNMNGTTPANGHTTVRISGPGSAIPDATVVDRVQADLESRDIANITIHVMTFSTQSQDVHVDVTLSTDPEFTLDDVTPSVVSAITDFIDALGVGSTLYVAGLTDAVYGLPGIVDVEVTTPGSNVAAADAITKIVPGAITVGEI